MTHIRRAGVPLLVSLGIQVILPSIHLVDHQKELATCFPLIIILN